MVDSRDLFMKFDANDKKGLEDAKVLHDEKEQMARSYYQTAELLLNSRMQSTALRQATQRWGRQQLRQLRQSETHLARARGLAPADPASGLASHPHRWMLDVLCDLGTYAEEHGLSKLEVRLRSVAFEMMDMMTLETPEGQ